MKVSFVIMHRLISFPDLVVHAYHPNKTEVSPALHETLNKPLIEIRKTVQCFLVICCNLCALLLA